MLVEEKVGQDGSNRFDKPVAGLLVSPDPDPVEWKPWCIY